MLVKDTAFRIVLREVKYMHNINEGFVSKKMRDYAKAGRDGFDVEPVLAVEAGGQSSGLLHQLFHMFPLPALTLHQGFPFLL